MSLAQTVTRQHAGHEKWMDCIYPACSAPAHVNFLALMVETNNNGPRKTLLSVNGKYVSLIVILIAFRAATIIYTTHYKY